jgi:hypothetical protein
MDSDDHKPETAYNASVHTSDSQARPRHMKGRQVATALYLAPEMYWNLKALSRRSRRPIQGILRDAITDWMDRHRHNESLQ